MDLIFTINGENPDPHLGIIEGYILEGINQVTTIELILVSQFPLSDEACSDYIGAMATIGMAGIVEDQLKISRFDGRVYEFHVLDEVGIEKGLHKYQMIVRPQLWDLNFHVHARSFPNSTRIEVVETVLKEHGFTDGHHYKAMYQNKKIYAKQPQVVQNQVSDLVFIQQLLKEAGVNYYFSADKEGEKQTFLKLADNNIFFDDIAWTVVPYIPDSGQTGEMKIETLETHYRAIPKKTIATTFLGDGKTQVFTTRHAIADGNVGEFRCFGVEGESCDVSKKAAMIDAQHFQSSRVLYEGRSNFFIFRIGEKFKVGDRYGNSMRDVLMTQVFHHFVQTPASAISGDNQVEYNNYFSGTEKLAEIRPDQTDKKTIVEMKRIFSQRHSLSRESLDQTTSRTDIDDLEKQALRQLVAELRNELNMTRDYSGVMVGEVVEDAKVTSNNELVCVVRNELFPDGLTIKIALGWLSQHGWLSLLPRVGVQVYFQFVSGKGGGHEAVLLGYRPTADHPLMNPAKNTDSSSLDSDEENAVGDASFSPLNKHRNALMGEHGVAEIAVVDGGEDSVYLHAANRICAKGDKSVNISTRSLHEKAGGASQNFGSLTRKVSKKQKVTIGGDLERTVELTTTETTKGDVNISSTEGLIDILGHNQVKLHDDDGAFVDIDKNNIKASLNGEKNFIEIAETGITEAAEDAKVLIASGGTVYVTSGKNSSAHFLEDRAVFKANASVIEMKTDGTIDITSKSTVNVKGDSTVFVEGGEVEIKGSKVKLNS